MSEEKKTSFCLIFQIVEWTAWLFLIKNLFSVYGKYLTIPKKMICWSWGCAALNNINKNLTYITNTKEVDVILLCTGN